MVLMSEEVNRWRQELLADEWWVYDGLIWLERTFHGYVVALCRHLLQDPLPLVSSLALRVLGNIEDAGDSVVEEAALAALKDPTKCEHALQFLGKNGSPAVFPVLLKYAQLGYAHGLRAARGQANTAEQCQQILPLARHFLFAEAEELREEAVWTLRILSNAVAEETLLLEAAQRFLDPWVFEILRQATPGALPILQQLQTTLPPGRDEHQALAHTIEVLQ